MEANKAVIIFCEGAHDVAFVSRILRYCKSTKEIKEPFSHFPFPFSNLFMQNVKRHAPEDLTLEMAKKFYLPDRVFEHENLMYLLFNTGGNTNYEDVKKIIKDFLILYETADTFQDEDGYLTIDVKYLFLYDADSNLPKEVGAKMQKEYETIEDVGWLLKPWEMEASDRYSIQIDKAFFVWCEDNSLKGTLEDIIHPIYKTHENGLLQESEKFVNASLGFNLIESSTPQSYANNAKMKKATICCAGQKKKPGAPLSAIIHDNVLSNKETFIADRNVIHFVSFINSFSGDHLVLE